MTPESPLDALRRLDREATAAPWRTESTSLPAPDGYLDDAAYVTAEGATVALPMDERNANFVVTLRNTLPALLRLVDAAKQLNEELDIEPLHTALAELTTPAPAKQGEL